jgi:hypothetical protein
MLQIDFHPLSPASFFPLVEEFVVISTTFSMLKVGSKVINFMPVQFAFKRGNFSATDVTRVA